MENLDVNSHLKPSDFFFTEVIEKKTIARGTNFSINGTGKLFIHIKSEIRFSTNKDI